MDIFTWLVVGLVAGVLASAIMGEYSFGLLGDIALGIIGALVGGWSFRELGWNAPFPGIAGVITVALIGAVLVLAFLRLINARTGTGRRR